MTTSSTTDRRGCGRASTAWSAGLVTLGVGEDRTTPSLDAVRAVVRGERNDTDRLLDFGRLLVAVEAALTGDRTIRPNDDAVDDLRVDGAEFLGQYDPYY